jgi:hypothetical protein
VEAKQLDDGVGDTFVSGGCEWQRSRVHFYLCLDIPTIPLNDSRASEGAFTKTASFSSHELLTKGRIKHSKDREPSRSQTMIHAEEIRKGQSEIPFSLAIFETKPSRRETDVAAADLAQPARSNELNLSGSQVLAGMSMLSVIGFSMWALLKRWLFER